jgi:FtsZ-interacting cell division protein ZipA
LTNFVIFGEEGFISQTTIYIIIGIIILIALILIAFKFGKRKSQDGYYNHKEKDIRITKLSELNSRKKDDSEKTNKEIFEAEKKLHEAEKEINKIRNRDKIDSLKQEIRRLEKGD